MGILDTLNKIEGIITNKVADATENKKADVKSKE